MRKAKIMFLSFLLILGFTGCDSNVPEYSPAPTIYGSGREIGSLDASCIYGIEIGIMLGGFTPGDGRLISDREQISMWVAFFTSIQLTAIERMFPNSNAPGMIFVIYYADGSMDKVFYHYNSLFFNSQHYHIDCHGDISLVDLLRQEAAVEPEK